MNGASEEHFLPVLHMYQLDAGTITAANKDSKGFDYHKLVGQGYDGASPFSGKHSGVQIGIHTVSGYPIYIHCAYHRL